LIRFSDTKSRHQILPTGRSSTIFTALNANNEIASDTMLNVDTNSLSQNLNNTTAKLKPPHNDEHKNNEMMVKESDGDIDVKSTYVPVYKHNYVSPLKNPQPSTSSSPMMTTKTTASSTPVGSNVKKLLVDKFAADSTVNDVKEKEAEMKEQEEDEEKDVVSRKNVAKSEEEDDEGEQFSYTDDDLDEALAVNDDEKIDQSREIVVEGVEMSVDEPSTPKNLEATFDTSESHYLPMTPKKAILSSSASETSILAMDILNSIRNPTEVIEENPYIEMSSGLSEMSSEKHSSPYELVMVSNKKDGNEPLYMELSQNSTKDNKPPKKSPNESKNLSTGKKRHVDRSSFRNKKRHDLPDILKQSQQTYKSDDSSDADDEDVSNEEPMTMKSRSRFSLSDTFRPASYYLGASTSSTMKRNTPLAECFDSSDSEIAPPPPIPSSPPPPLDTDEFFSSENFNTIKRNSTTSNEIIHQRTMSASSNPLSDRPIDISRTSRLSLQDQLIKQQRNEAASGYLNLPQFEKLKNAKLFSTASNCSINTDDESNTSSDFDLYNKIKLRSPSISADSLNHSQLSLTDSSPRTRLPLSNDSLFKFAVEDEQNANDKLDHYLDKLESSDLLFSKQQSSLMTESFRNLSTLGDASSSSTFYYENINLLEKQQQQQQQQQQKQIQNEKSTITANSSSTIYYDSLEDVSNKNIISGIQDVQPLKEKNLSLHDALHQDDIQNRNYDPTDESSTIMDTTQPSHSRNNSNLSDSAPYYYSDLTGAEAQAQAQANIQQKLNNQQQRDLPSARKIPHIHNLISTNAIIASTSTSTKQQQQLSSILKDQAEKEQGIDRKNIYESGSVRMQKLVNKDEPSVASFANKIYYHEKNTNVDGGLLASSIDNLLYSLPPSSIGGDSSLNNESIQDTSSVNVDCDQLWEEDAIWRESLRRVSQRHARSLDDLDRIASISSAATKAAKINDADREWGVAAPSSSSTTSSVERKSRAKITRDVTYVNEEHQRNLTIKKKKKNVEPSKLDENDVYVQLACTPQIPQIQSPLDVYETLRTDDNIDRENIRQWDLMSSGLVKSSSVNSRLPKDSLIGSGTSSLEPSTDNNGEKGKFTTSKPSNNRQSN
jgi:hypothetical protein